MKKKMENTVKIVGIKKMLKKDTKDQFYFNLYYTCLLYTSPSPRD